VFEEQTLTADQLVRFVMTKHREEGLSGARLESVLQHLCDENVIVLGESGLAFSHAHFLARARLQALESLVEFHDHRVVEVVRVLFGKALFHEALVDAGDRALDAVTVIPTISDITALSSREIGGDLASGFDSFDQIGADVL
jgi:hypothetical protein